MNKKTAFVAKNWTEIISMSSVKATKLQLGLHTPERLPRPCTT